MLVERPPRRRSFWALAVLALLASMGCENCDQRGTIGVCGRCTRTSECAAGLFCTNGTCETAPPMCHVEIGL